MALIIYTKPGCPYCQQARDYYNSKGITFVDRDAQTNKEFRAEMFNPFNHPNLFIAGGTNNIANNATGTVEVTRGGLFDNINNVEQHRNIQLALKFTF